MSCVLLRFSSSQRSKLTLRHLRNLPTVSGLPSGQTVISTEAGRCRPISTLPVDPGAFQNLVAKAANWGRGGDDGPSLAKGRQVEAALLSPQLPGARNAEGHCPCANQWVLCSCKCLSNCTHLTSTPEPRATGLKHRPAEHAFCKGFFNTCICTAARSYSSPVFYFNKHEQLREIQELLFSVGKKISYCVIFLYNHTV